MESARPATVDDLDVLVALAAEAIDELRPQRGGALWALREARPEPLSASLLADLADDRCLVMLGLVDDYPMGYGVVRLESLRDGESLAVVEDLYVEPGARAVGLGEALMEHLVAFAEQQGCVGIDAVALPGNRETKNFFERFGLTARAIVVHRSLGPS